MGRKIKDLTGIRYDRLIVIKLTDNDWNGATLWLCKCNCGNEKIIRGNSLLTGNTKSCGCLQREKVSKTNKDNSNYKNGKYCGRNSKVIQKLKEKIRKRDNYICQECSMTQEQSLIKYGRILDVHHIDGDDTNNIEENMITLCKSCHNNIKISVNQ